jgi:hypothetical protein
MHATFSVRPNLLLIFGEEYKLCMYEAPYYAIFSNLPLT